MVNYDLVTINQKKGMNLKMEINYTVTKEFFNSYNEILKNELQISTKLLQKLIKENRIKINGTSINTKLKPNINDKINISFSYKEDNSNIIPKKMPLSILYEDDWILIISKPAGIAIHPSMLHFEDSLSNGIKYYFDTIGLHKKIRPVNRLDFGTSGIVIFAKCEYIQEYLIKEMQSNQFEKRYLALVNGNLEKKTDTINLPIARKPNSIIERCIDFKKGKTAITHYKVLNDFESSSLVECVLETGRTHQIRVHFSYLNHPLVGDTLYGDASSISSFQMLHCYRVEFVHPVGGKKITITDYPKWSIVTRS